MKFRVLSGLMALALLLCALTSCNNGSGESSSAKSKSKDSASVDSEISSELLSDAQDDDSSEDTLSATGRVSSSASVSAGSAAMKSSQAVSSQSAPGKAAKINVKDYGAVGDGKTDDGRAIEKAVTALRMAAPGSSLNFESGKTYYYKTNGTTFRALFYLRNSKKITINGNNALIKLGGTNLYYFDIVGCEDIVIQNINLDYAEYKPAFAAKLQSMDVAAGSAVVTVDRDINLSAGETYYPPRDGWFGVIPAPNGRHHMHIKSYQVIDLKTNKIRINFDKTNDLTASRLSSSLINQYGFVMPMPASGNMIERGMTVTDVHNFVFKNINIYSTSRHGFVLYNNTGELLLENVNHVRAPYDQDLKFTSWGDNYHLLHNRAPYIWKNCKNEWEYDDVFNISAATHTVTKKHSANEITIVGSASTGTSKAMVGDTLCILNTTTGKLLGRPKVIAVVEQDSNYNRVKIGTSIPGLEVGAHIKVWIEDTVAPGSQMINCDMDGTFRCRAFISFINCKFYVRRFWMGLETIDHEGPIARNILFQNCDLTGDGGVVWEIASGANWPAENIVFQNCKGISMDKITKGPNDSVTIK